jgi:ribose 5-phosphate isomerase A
MAVSRTNENPDFTFMVNYVIKQHIKNNQIVGLGSGRTMAYLVKELAKTAYNKNIKFIATSLQIAIEAEKAGLDVMIGPQAEQIDIVFDGADQIDSNLIMIKGGGGALLREKIVMYNANKVIILADSSKFVYRLTRSVPIEVHPFARTTVHRTILKEGARLKLRQTESGYPYFTDNGNIIFDIYFSSIPDPCELEKRLCHIPGVIEVGIFTRRADRYYEALFDGSFKIRSFHKKSMRIIPR